MSRPPIALSVAVVAVVALVCGGMVGMPLLLFGQAQAEAAACEVPLSAFQHIRPR
ncbi:hypothetical protein [Micromonospora sp. LOL_023]|uniref:hypothetical protein n=1 Tax=Micromonospora sp. LOL_023 TaxID=3345418 RepID=UPI003A8B2D7D